MIMNVAHHLCRSASLSVSSEAALLAFAMNGCNEMLNSLWGEVSASWASMNLIAEPLPTYSSANEASYLAEMLDSDRIVKLSAAIDKLQSSLQNYKEVAGKIGLLHDDFDKAGEAAKCQLAQVCTVTCVRILCSKSAQMLSPSLRQSVIATLDYAKTHDLQLEQGVLERLQQLLDALTDASAPKKRRTA